MDNPLLTVLITNYNHGRYLSQAIDSLLIQDFSSYEILIIDDGSTDHSVEVIDSYVARYPCIRVIKYAKNQGVCFALNDGTEKARGVYLHTMAADDYRLPGFFSKTMGILLKNPDIGVACSAFGYVHGENPGEAIQTIPQIPDIYEAKAFNSKEIVRVFQTTHFWIPGHTAIYKRELAAKHQKYNPDLKFYCDWFLLHRIALHHGAAYVPETLSVWVIYSNSYSGVLTSNKIEKKKVYYNVLKILSERKNKATRALFMKSTLLQLVFKTLFREVIYKPQYWGFLWYLKRKSLYWRVKKISLWAKNISCVLAIS